MNWISDIIKRLREVSHRGLETDELFAIYQNIRAHVNHRKRRKKALGMDVRHAEMLEDKRILKALGITGMSVAASAGYHKGAVHCASMVGFFSERMAIAVGLAIQRELKITKITPQELMKVLEP